MTGRAGSYSLQNRLLLAFSALLTVFLGLTGVVLDRAFRSSVEAGVAEQLQVQIYVLLAAVEEGENGFYLGEGIREPRFSQLNSGLYGFVSSEQHGVLLRTPSALDVNFEGLELPLSELARGETTFSRVRSADDEYFVSSYAVIWEHQQEPFVFSVLESTSTYQAEVTKFRTSLWSWLGGVALLLLALQLLLLHWGLTPLRRLAADLMRIESGESEQLRENYPKELRAVTDNLNMLIKSERKQQSRYRTTLGDLAHSLKTPLAVVQGIMESFHREQASHQQVSLVEEQLERMNQIISYQLQRAVKSSDTVSLARRVNLGAVVNKVVRALEKVYADKNVRIDVKLDEGVLFLGDERDLMEILGNLLDNACKYGNGKVWVSATVQQGVARQLSLVVEDNGPGISGANRGWVLQRGARLDTLEPGQGIGLAVVADIVSSYGGQIEVDNNASGGARVQIVFSNFQLSARHG